MLNTDVAKGTGAWTVATGNAEMSVELAVIIAAWPQLPEAIKVGIVAMVKAAGIQMQ